MGSQRNEYTRIIRAAESAGWRTRSGKSHVIIYPPQGRRPIPVPRSSSTGRKAAAILRSLTQQCRRAGLDLEGA